MELSPQAIKSLLSRARVNLKEILEPYLQDGQLPEGAGPQAGAAKGDADDQSETG